MTPNQATSALGSYQEMGVSGNVEQANGHGLITMLFDALILKLSTAKRNIEIDNIPEKAQALSKGVAIIDGLRCALNKEQGGDIAANLDDLYDYMQRRLSLANVNNDVEIISEVQSLAEEIREAWVLIPEESRK